MPPYFTRQTKQRLVKRKSRSLRRQLRQEQISSSDLLQSLSLSDKSPPRRRGVRGAKAPRLAATATSNSSAPSSKQSKKDNHKNPATFKSTTTPAVVAPPTLQAAISDENVPGIANLSISSPAFAKPKSTATAAALGGRLVEKQKASSPKNLVSVPGVFNNNNSINNNMPESSATEPAAKKKRIADRQLTKDDDPEAGIADAEGDGKGGFAKADAAVLQRRRIVKARRPGGTSSTAAVTTATTTTDSNNNDNTAAKSSNPFANTILVAANDSKEKESAPKNPFANTKLVAEKKEDDNATTETKSSIKVFGAGSGFGGFGTAVASTSTTTSTGFGGGFGSSTHYKGFATTPSGGSSSGFGGFGATSDKTTATTSTATGFGAGTTKNLFDVKPGTTPSFGFGTSSSKSETTNNGTEASPTKTTTIENGKTQEAKSAESSPAKPVVPVAALPEHVDLTTGEENETVIFELRSKLFKLGEATTTKATAIKAVAAPCVAPSTSSFSNKDSDTDKSSKDDKESVTSDKEKDNHDKSSADGENTNKPKKQWHEQGKGPLKLLEGGPNKLRLVQRFQGSTTGDKPTKVILNIPFWKEAKITKTSEKDVQIVLPVPAADGSNKTEVATYSFKFNESNATKFFEIMTNKQKTAKSCFAGDGDDKKAP